MDEINASDDPPDPLPPPEILPVQTMLTEFETVNFLAPLVRCSKLPFRHLCSLYETHVTHTPMILAEEFSRSQAARVSDFTTSGEERGVFWMEPRRLGSASGSSSRLEGVATSSHHPERAEAITHHKAKSHARLPPTLRPPTKNSRLVRGALLAQFASPNATSLADAAELISPYVDGLDLNCGCPQKWAYHEGIGCALLRKPELVRDMVRAVKSRLGWGWPVSVKIRVDPDLACVVPPSSLYEHEILIEIQVDGSIGKDRGPGWSITHHHPWTDTTSSILGTRLLGGDQVRGRGSEGRSALRRER